MVLRRKDSAKMKKILKKTLQILCPDLLVYRRYRRYLKMPKEQYPEELKKIYQKRTGFPLDLENPERLTEKIQWRKLFDPDDVYAVLSDKYAVRAWVEKKIGTEYLIPLLGVWERSKDIPFHTLPEAFVLKTNNGSHTNIIVKDRRTFKPSEAKEKLTEWMRLPIWFDNGFEMQYRKIRPLVIAEAYMQPEDGAQDLTDYKFFCYGGTPVYCQVIRGRSEKETIDFFDMEWNHMEFVGMNIHAANSKTPISRPACFGEMRDVAAKLSNGFAFVRVDLYVISGRVYFGEMIFTPGGGLGRFTPDEWDYKLGSLWDIHTQQVNREQVGI